jgi:hypothetical protein
MVIGTFHIPKAKAKVVNVVLTAMLWVTWCYLVGV